jgi:hypothetical protein
LGDRAGGIGGVSGINMSSVQVGRLGVGHGDGCGRYAAIS